MFKFIDNIIGEVVELTDKLSFILEINERKREYGTAQIIMKNGYYCIDKIQ
jgi:hypothetical protein